MTPQEKKYLQYGGLALALVVVYFVAFKKKDDTGSTADPTGNGENTNPSGSAFSAKNVADTLLDAMKDLGTDEDAIISILKNISQVQFGAVVTAFGKHQYNATLGNQINPTAWFDQLPYVDLKGWLKSELSSLEYGNLRRKYPKYL